ncbi:MAG: AAA-associated domain-containing protein [Caldivirga sp.]
MGQRSLIMPLDSRLTDVIGLIDTILNDFGGRADIYAVAQHMDADLDDIIPNLNAAIYLGFVKVDSGDVVVTELGVKFLNSKIPERRRMLRDLISNIEPFKTAIEIGRSEPFPLDKLITALINKGYSEFKAPGIRDLLMVLLSEWGAYAGLIKKRGDEYIIV